MRRFLSSNPLDVLNEDSIIKLRQLEECEDLDFLKAVEILELDPKKDFRFSDLTDLEIDEDQLSGFDFTGSRMGRHPSSRLSAKQAKRGKRVEFTIARGREARLFEIFDEFGQQGYSTLPVLGGSGASGQWTLEGPPASQTQKMIAVVFTAGEKESDLLVDRIQQDLSSYIGIISIEKCGLFK